jgi:hypothetical protein
MFQNWDFGQMQIYHLATLLTTEAQLKRAIFFLLEALLQLIRVTR